MTYHPEDVLSGYMDDELQPEERLEVEDHLRSCEQCQTLIKELYDLKQKVTSTYHTIEAPLGMEQRIIQLIELKSTSSVSTTKAWFALPLTGFLCLAVLFMFLGPILIKFVSVCFRFLIALTYALPSMITTLPMVTSTLILFSIFVLIISSFSLRRLLRASIS